MAMGLMLDCDLDRNAVMLYCRMQMADGGNEGFHARAVVLVSSNAADCGSIFVTNLSWALAIFEKEEVCQLSPAN